jgi:hypothetical protein
MVQGRQNRMMYRTRNSVRRTGRGLGARVDALEGEIAARSAPAETDVEHFWKLVAWASRTGEHTRALSKRWFDLSDEWFVSYLQARESGEITPGETFPRALTGQRNLAPERSARWAEIDREQGVIVAKLESLRLLMQREGEQ